MEKWSGYTVKLTNPDGQHIPFGWSTGDDSFASHLTDEDEARDKFSKMPRVFGWTYELVRETRISWTDSLQVESTEV